MAILFPQRKAEDQQTANTASATGSVLGEQNRLQTRGFGRPRRISTALPLVPRAFLGGASTPDVMFAQREAQRGS